MSEQAKQPIPPTEADERLRRISAARRANETAAQRAARERIARLHREAEEAKAALAAADTNPTVLVDTVLARLTSQLALDSVAQAKPGDVLATCPTCGARQLVGAKGRLVEEAHDFVRHHPDLVAKVAREKEAARAAAAVKQSKRAARSAASSHDREEDNRYGK